jgi:hypothetical protein
LSRSNRWRDIFLHPARVLFPHAHGRESQLRLSRASLPGTAAFRKCFRTVSALVRPGVAVAVAQPEPIASAWRCFSRSRRQKLHPEGIQMNGIIYVVGLVVVVMFLLSLLGLR